MWPPPPGRAPRHRGQPHPCGGVARPGLKPSGRATRRRTVNASPWVPPCDRGGSRARPFRRCPVASRRLRRRNTIGPLDAGCKNPHPSPTDIPPCTRTLASLEAGAAGRLESDGCGMLRQQGGGLGAIRGGWSAGDACDGRRRETGHRTPRVGRSHARGTPRARPRSGRSTSPAISRTIPCPAVSGASAISRSAVSISTRYRGAAPRNRRIT